MTSVSVNTTSRARPDLRLLTVPALLRRSWKLVAATSATFVLVVLAWLALMPATYTVTTVFVPSAQSTSLDLAAISAGLGLGGATSGQSLDQLPAFYVDLLHSREMLGSLSEAVVAGGRGQTISQALGTREVTPALTRASTADALAGIVHSSVLQRTGVVRLSVSATDPALSYEIANRLLRMVDSFNIAKLQGRGASERRFAQARIEEVTAELRTAENRLQAFMEQNRAYGTSSPLAVVHDRLERDVATKQDLLTNLMTTRARAEQDATRDTPVIAIVERPELPARPDSRGFVPLGLLAAVCGALCALVAAHVMAERARLRGALPS